MKLKRTGQGEVFQKNAAFWGDLGSVGTKLKSNRIETDEKPFTVENETNGVYSRGRL